MMTSTISTMLTYHHWANEKILNRLWELPASILQQEIPSSYPTIAATLEHLYAVDRMWYLVLTGVDMATAIEQSRSFMEVTDDWDLTACAARFAEQAQQYKVWLEQTNLEHTLELHNPYAGVRYTSNAEVLLQVANHGTYHRGNITTMLRQLGHSSVMNDYILFLYEQLPQPTPESAPSVK